jgi:hypothetical protein
VTVLASSSDPYGHKFVTAAYANLQAYGINATLTPTPESLKALVPPNIETGPLKGREGYSNPVGGWAEAARATEVGLKRVEKLGGKVRGGCEVVGLEKADGGKKIEGVVLKSGEIVRGDLVLVSEFIMERWRPVTDGRLPLELGRSAKGALSAAYTQDTVSLCIVRCKCPITAHRSNRVCLLYLVPGHPLIP